MAKSAKEVHVATKDLRWTAGQIDKQEKWEENWTEANGKFYYYVEDCTHPNDKRTDGCNICTVKWKVRTHNLEKTVIIIPTKSELLKNLMSDRVYLRQTVYPGSSPKEYDVYILADSRVQSVDGDGEADRVISSESKPEEMATQIRKSREYRELAIFFNELKKFVRPEEQTEPNGAWLNKELEESSPSGSEHPRPDAGQTDRQTAVTAEIHE